MTAGTTLDRSPVNVRIKLSALWTSTLFIFAYVDLFSLYRPDFRADVEAGEIGEWSYFILGSAIEVMLLAGIVYYAWNWPRGA